MSRTLSSRAARPLALFLTLVAAPALAETAFAPVPAEQTGGQATGLEVRMVKYAGSTNGEIEVEVRNPTTQPREFVARGLYFVPSGNADSAPQRVGAVGPFQSRTAAGWERHEKLSIAPGATVRMRIDVYCIDSHRGSPSSSTSFRVARDRVPKPVVDAIDKDARQAAQGLGGVAAPAAKSAVQGEVWKNRDKKWIPLDGEGKQEAAKSNR